MNSQRITGYFGKIKKWLFLIAIILMLTSIVRTFRRVVVIRGEVAKERERVEALKKENEELERRIAETKSDEFIEKQIRDKLGLAREGEIVVVLPEEEIVRSFAPKVVEEEDSLPDPNWKKWLKLFI